MAITKAIRVPILRNANYIASGSKSYVWLLKKYNIKPTSGLFQYDTAQSKLVKKQAATGKTSDITADDIQNDSLYTVPCEIGGQTVNLDLDTGSSDLWVLSTKLSAQLQTTVKTNGLHLYDPSNAQPVTGSTWQITYGDQSSASGNVVTDTFKIGNITVEQQAIEVATQASPTFLSGGSDGLCGLAFDTINTVKPTPVKTPVDNMIAQQDIPADMEVFTCYLGSYKDKNNPDQGTSFYTFGAIDQSVVEASGQAIEYIPVDNSQGFWQWTCPSISINGQSQTLSSSVAILDTGTTLLLLDDQTCDSIYKQIPGAKLDSQQGGYVFPASTADTDIPEVTFPWGTQTVTIAPEYFGFESIPNSSPAMVYGGIQSNQGLGMMIMGDVFLKNIYAIWDVSKPQLGMVPRFETNQGMSTQ